MATILMALSLGAISMIIVFISGLASNAVRLGTLSLRSFIAFCITSVITYILLMIFEMYDEKRRKETDKIAKEVAEDEKKSEGENENVAGDFQAINPTDIPRA